MTRKTDTRDTAAGRKPARHRNAERTQAEILAAAVREFAEHGFHGARVERITKAANCNARMIYHYYGSKEKLYLAALDNVYASIRNRETELNLRDDDPASAARRLVEFTFDYFSENTTFMKLTRNENLLDGRYIRRSHMIRDMSQPLILALGQLVERGHASGAFSRKPDPLQLYLSIVALSAHHLNNSATLSAVFGQDLGDPDWSRERRAHAVDMIMRYLGVAETSPLDAAGALDHSL